MDIFDTCYEVNEFLERGQERPARDLLIQLLAELQKGDVPYPVVLNHLIRRAGLYPYLQLEGASWDQRFVHGAFGVDVGGGVATLHREQSIVLGKLLSGASVAVSAPTSFGKSFIIDAYIAATAPNTVVILVPTIALMDETRRRIYRKFSRDYSVVTAPDTTLGTKNIFIFPQERAFGYISRIDKIDLMVVDEFYKTSTTHDKDRAPSLIKAILKLSRKANQRYYLAPNIKRLANGPITDGMEFLELLDFNTVYLEKHEDFLSIGSDEELKSERLLQLIGAREAKSLVYAGTYAEIEKIADLVINRMERVDRVHTNHFARWLRKNYASDWRLADLVERGVGVHNGRMHRCLSQLQVKIFSIDRGFDTIVSTSSIIEGVNTSAQNVVIWRNRIGRSSLKDFTYKNIIGRGGRMFKYFVGKIYLLEQPPAEEDTQLEIEFPETILGDLDELEDGDKLTLEQIDKVLEYKQLMSRLIGADQFDRIRRENLLRDSDSDFLLRLAQDMHDNPADWRGLGYLNSSDPDRWERMLYKVVRLKPGGWDGPWGTLVSVVKVLSDNWTTDIPSLLNRLGGGGVSIDEFFQLERNVTFKLAALMHDVNVLYQLIVDASTDISRFVAKLSHAFLPGAVYHLEEYGLPRMIAKKIHASGLVPLASEETDIRSALGLFQEVGLARLLEIQTLDPFDKYVLKYFYEGITPET